MIAWLLSELGLMAHVLHVIHIHMLACKLIWLLILDRYLETWLHLLNVLLFLLLDKLEEWPQPVLSLEQVLNRILIFSDERRLHEAILGVLNQLSEVDHQSPWVGSQSLKTLEEDSADLLLYIWLRFNEQPEEYETEEVSVAIGVPELVDDAVHEAEPCVFVQLDCNLFEKVDVFLLVLLGLACVVLVVTCPLRDEKDYRVDHGRVRHDPTIQPVLALHHLDTDLIYQYRVSTIEVVLEVLLQAILREVTFEVTQDAWVSDVKHCVDFQVLGERVWRLNRFREGSQYHVLELNRVVWECIDEVEMEVAEELRVVFQDDENDVHRGCVEASHCGGSLRTRQEVMLDEREAAHQ